MQYMIVTEDIIPVVRSSKNTGILELYLQLQMPLILEVMLMIFLLFESFPNALAELSLFADREFYQDWWNATTIEEFYSKWLRFSYLFFYRHVFMRLQIKFKYS
jgi:sterol O-acyltransferase